MRFAVKLLTLFAVKRCVPIHARSAHHVQGTHHARRVHHVPEGNTSFQNKKRHPFGCLFCLEVTPGFEPGNEGFADLCLTTWLCHHMDKRSNWLLLLSFGAGDGARTRYLHLGKVALYQMSYARRTVLIICILLQFVNTVFQIKISKFQYQTSFENTFLAELLLRQKMLSHFAY